jgi:DNA-directed RNA polymerase specialized sigma24 family protein
MRELRREGLSYQAIADRLGCSEGTVMAYARSGRSIRPLINISVIQVRNLKALGLSFRRIAVVLGCSREAARRRFGGRQPQRKVVAQRARAVRHG